MAADKAIDRFFGAALNPTEWPAVLSDIAQSLGADGATLVIGASSRQTLIESSTIQSHVAEYFRRGAPFDPREARVNLSLAEGFADDFAHFRPEEILRDPFYQEFLVPIGLGWHAVACLTDGIDPIILSLKRGVRHGPFARSEIAALDRLLPHLRGAAVAARQAWARALDDQLATLTAIGRGGLLVDRRGRVTAVGAAVALGDGLDVTAGMPRAAFAADQRDLDRVTAIATARAAPSDLPPPQVATLRRPSGRRPLVVHGIPLDSARRSLVAPAVALLLVTDLDAAPRPAAATIRAVFGLTPREAALAERLAAGDTLEQSAEALSITSAHARQRLKIVFDKCGVTRQSQLVALLQRLP